MSKYVFSLDLGWKGPTKSKAVETNGLLGGFIWM